MKDLKIGLALGGGGARGFCHIGVLKVLEKNGIIPYAIAGTSMGSIIGGLYASGMTVREMEDYVSKLRVTKVMDINYFRSFKDGLIKGSRIRKILSELKKCENVEDCKIKFISTAYDLHTGNVVYLENGKLEEVIYPSMAVPSILKPYKIDDMLLIDGGIVQNTPVTPLINLGCDVIIAVDPIGKYDYCKSYDKSIFTFLANVLNIQIRIIQKPEIDLADICITPVLDGVFNFDFKPKTNLKVVKSGEEETNKLIKQILHTIEEKR